MERLRKHGEGEIEMTPTQIRAAEIFLKKTIPDVSAITHKGDATAPIHLNHIVTTPEQAKSLYSDMLKQSPVAPPDGMAE
ncbi:MAG: hypothetical protein ACRD4H_04700 [Candidatus Acidiferrales bacterium]